ncbi:hypothetical protein GCM10010912_51380 [Paenibacillus albidus]|uniref:Uncharacterized protein n=1 Tax=Paenibacillus albidus TaxID=2041023 RepID=A0A917CUP8_9BACL|nr:hypothetical protein [Paenibacillus albidus]GGG00223.1 hypothetical protein GCM10010912_51380 [Paenibacillus albidus]
MFDYISVHSNDYTKKIKSMVLEQYLTRNVGFTKISHLTFCKEINGKLVRLTGIPANPDGSYAFNTLNGIEEVNLIEIDVPRYIDDTIELAISGIASSIAKEFSWIIDDDHGLN